MAFGKTLDQKSTTKEPQSYDPVFLPLTEGKRTFRVLTSEVQFKVVWYDNARVGDKVTKKPIIIGVLIGGTFVGADGDYFGNNPYSDWVAQEEARLNDELPEAKVQEIMRARWPKSRFYVNVYDRTPVIHEETKDGVKIHYPDASNKYAVAGTPQPNNSVRVIDQSAGKEGGKHFLQQLVTVSSDMYGFETGEPIGVYDGDIQCITKGTGISTVRTLGMAPNQKPLEVTEIYDIWSFVKPWPHDAIKAVLDGEDYNEVRKSFNIPFMPQRIEVTDISQYR